MADELLDAHASKQFYHHKNVTVWAKEGGDHVISDYQVHVDAVLDWAVELSKQNS